VRVREAWLGALVLAACGHPAPTPAVGSPPAPAPSPRVVSGPPRVAWDLGADDAPEAGMLRLVNEYRRVAGVAPVEVDPSLARGCREHAHYMVINRDKPQLYSINAHHQDPALPGATPEGAACGEHAVLYPNVADLREAVHAWMATIYHRRPIVSPQILRVGIGSYPLPVPGRLAAALQFVYAPADPATFPIIYPADGQLDVPIDFRSEAPNPIPPGGSATPGYPITLYFPPYDPLTGASATLTDGAGDPVPFYFSSPEKPASPYTDQFGTIGLIPEQTLRPDARYTATITATWRGKTGTWTTTFSTVARIEADAADEASLLAAVGKPARVRGVIKDAHYITEHSIVMHLQGPPPGGQILTIQAIVSTPQVDAAIALPPATSRAVVPLFGKTVEIEATPALMFGTLRLDAPPTSAFRVIR